MEHISEPVGRVRHHVTLTRADVLALVMPQDADAQRLERKLHALGIPSHATIFVQVPGGGDWARTDLVLGDDIPHLHISWTAEK